jgi:hypothetical protein
VVLAPGVIETYGKTLDIKQKLMAFFMAET